MEKTIKTKVVYKNEKTETRNDEVVPMEIKFPNGSIETHFISNHLKNHIQHLTDKAERLDNQTSIYDLKNQVEAELDDLMANEEFNDDEVREIANNNIPPYTASLMQVLASDNYLATENFACKNRITAAQIAEKVINDRLIDYAREYVEEKGWKLKDDNYTYFNEEDEDIEE